MRGLRERMGTAGDKTARHLGHCKCRRDPPPVELRRIIIAAAKHKSGDKAGIEQSEDAPGARAPKIHIPVAHISDISLTKVQTPMQKTPDVEPAHRCVVLLAWIQYDLEYSRSHNPIKPADIRACLSAALKHKGVTAAVHAVRTKDTKNDGKGFKTRFDVWLTPTENIAEDQYLVTRFLALDAAINDVVQNKDWTHASDNEDAGRLRVAFPSNNSTVDTPEFMVTGFVAETHGTSRRHLKHIATAFFLGMNDDLHPSFKFDDLLDWLKEVGTRWGFFSPSDGETICILMLTFEKQSFAGKLLQQSYKNKTRPGIDILGTRHKLIPFPPREDKVMKRKVGKALRKSQRALKGLRGVPVPKVRFPLSAVEETTLVTNLPHCVCMSTLLVGNELRYSVMVALDPESAAYTSSNVQDGIKQAFPEMIDDTWVDTAADGSSGAGTDAEEAWNGQADVSAELQCLVWSSCDAGADDGDASAASAHRWSHNKLPTTKQKSKKNLYVIALGGNLPWNAGKAYPMWADCHRHVQGALNVKYMGFNSWTEAKHWYRQITGLDADPICVPEGEDPFAPAHIWEE